VSFPGVRAPDIEEAKADSVFAFLFLAFFPVDRGSLPASLND
jgi:hypothetical protein